MRGVESVQEVDGAIDAYAPGAFAFLERLIGAPSTVGYEDAAQQIVSDELRDIGFEVEDVTVPDTITAHPASGVAQQSYAGRKNVLATTGTGALDLLVNGHIDVVPADPSLWGQDPFTPRTSRGWMTGRGAGDMKCGFAMAVLAFRALRDAAPEALERPIGMISVIEEECTGNGTLSSILSRAKPRAVVLAEPTDLGLLLAGVGILWLDVELTGAGGHAFVADEVATPLGVVPALIDALEELAGEWVKEYPDDAVGMPSPYNVNVGTISAGDWTSSVPSRARLGVRLGHPRAMSTLAASRAASLRMTQAVSDRAPEITLTVSESGFRAEGYALDEKSPLVELVAACHESALGSAPQRFGLGSTTDARYYVNQLGVPALCYGPVAEKIHGVGERVLLSSIVDGARTLARLVMRLDELGAREAAFAEAGGRRS